MRYDQERGWWLISSPMSGNEYALFRFQNTKGVPNKFWHRVGCTCPAQNHIVPICYHKGHLYRMLQRGELGEVA